MFQSHILKSPILILAYVLFQLTYTLMAQDYPTQIPAAKGFSDFQKESMLSKLRSPAILETSNFRQSSFYSNTFKDRAHGLPTDSQRLDAGFEFLQHLGTGMNIPYSSVSDSAGNIYITGASANPESTQGDFLTIKLSPTGALLWETRQPGTLYAVDYGIQITLDAAGNPIATGVVWNGNDMDVLTIAYDPATGSELWSTTFDGGNSALDVPTTMTLSPTGDIFVGGITYTGTSIEYVLLKYSAGGQLQWSAVDTNPIAGSWNTPTAIAVDASGHVAITGYAAVDGDSNGYWEGYLTIVYNSAGEQQWRAPYLFERHIDETDLTSEMIPTHSAATSLAFDATGHLLVTGTFDVSSATRIGTLKYDTTGNVLWTQTYRAGEFQDHITNGHTVRIAGEDTIYVVGRHRAGWVDEGLVLLSYTDDGQENWSDETQNLIQITTAKLLLDENQLPIIAGLGYDEGTQDQRVRVLRYSESGTVLDETSYLKLFSSTEGIRQFVGLSVDNNNNVYLVLDNYYTDKGGVFETVKMAFDSGHNNPDWNYIYETPLSSSNTRMLDATSDSNNNTYVTGNFGVIETNQYFQNYFVAKYNEQGDVTWEKYYNQQNGNESNGIVVRVDADDNLTVFLLPSPEDPFPLRIKKYTPSGDLLWETEKEVHTALFRAFFLDDAGQIYVGGYSKENEADAFPVFTTIKYDAAGAEVWTRFAATDNPSDFVFEINAGSVDADGAIILTGVSGYSSWFSEVLDVAVLKYTSTGDLEWLNTYPQPDFASAGTDLYIDSTNAIYISGVQQEMVMQVEELVALKIDTNGEVLWTTSYGQSDEGRRIRPYKIMPNSDGNLVIPSYSLYWVVGESPNNRITSIQLNQENGEIAWEHNSEIGRYYREAYLDGDDQLFILNQAAEFAYQRLGSYTVASLLKIGAGGDTIEESFFVGPTLPDYDPSTLIPLDNGTLLLGGTLYNSDFYSGIYFFDSTHIPLGIPDHDGQGPQGANHWLGQNYPNPVHQTTTIPFFLKDGGSASFVMYDGLGREVYRLPNTNFNPGMNHIELNLQSLGAGIYYYQIKNDSYQSARKLIKQ